MTLSYGPKKERSLSLKDKKVMKNRSKLACFRLFTSVFAINLGEIEAGSNRILRPWPQEPPCSRPPRDPSASKASESMKRYRSMISALTNSDKALRITV